ncbi:hypothetical protein [Demequina sp. NBRC 110055]|uniref:hypothetical protein n=1 Tax=Demequina sp. NBRC 110055 TaxID=1570344 RepID=UPI000A03F678|nr:hypothetical protein [Demequina sp. NBRC 110055]
MANQTIQVSVLADTRKFSSAMRGLSKETGFKRLADGAKRLGKAMTIAGAAVGAVAAVGVKKAVDAASDLAESTNAVNVTFGKSAAGIKKLGEQAATSVGLANSEFNGLAVQFSSFASKIAGPGGDVVSVIDDITKRSADFASVMNIDVAEAASTFQSGLAGETEPLKKYGIDLSAAAVEAYALANGISDGTSEMTEAQKVQARYGSLMEQTAKTQGDFANTSDGFANSQRIIAARFTDISARIGSKFLPLAEKVTAWVAEYGLPLFEKLADDGIAWVSQKVSELTDWFRSDLLPVLQELYSKFQQNILPVLQQMAEWLTGTLIPALVDFGKWIIANRDWLAAIAIVIGTVVLGIQAYVKVMAIWKAVTTTAAAVQAVFNAVLSANPIGLVILAIAALVAGLVYFFTQTETGRKIIAKAWEGIKKAIKSVTDWWTNTAWPAIKRGWDAIGKAFQSGWNTVKRWMGNVLSFIKTVWGFSPLGLIVNNWNRITKAFSNGYNTVKRWLTNVKNFVIRVWSYNPVSLLTRNWDGIVSYFKSLPGRLVAGLGSLYYRLTSPFRSAFNAIAGYWNRTVGRVSFSIPSWVPGIGGRGWSLPRIPMLANGGIATSATLAMIGEGRESEAILPLSKLESLINREPRGGTFYEIHVHTGVGDPVQIGREVKRTIDAYERANGRRAA